MDAICYSNGTEDRVATDLGRLFKNGTYLQTSNGED